MKIITPLIQTKLRLPFTRSELVSRPRLQEQIAEGLRGPLTLITAPAGFGKTTLVAAYIADCGLPIAWLSLDKDDNREGRFLSYLVAALQEVDHTIGNEASQLMAASHQALPELVLTSLINDLDTTGREISLVLDDYHVISSQAVHSAVAFLIEHCPRTFHLVIASRSDPPLPLACLRARGQMIELRAADLSFTGLEAAQFLNDAMGLHLDARSVEMLEKRTEGWITGLQMAALSIRDRDDVPGFIEGFSGTNRYILDYLLEEVLASQPPEIQRFLLYTSILERLTAPLCDAVLAAGEGSASMLEHLEKANLFLVHLDDARVWYRYHHLFADLLRARLQQTLKKDDVVVLHAHAAQWYEQNGLTYEAIHHASLTSDHEWVERLIEQNYTEMMQRGESLSIRFWTGKLSKELVYRRPLLCLHEAMSLAWFGQVDQADEFLAQADKHLQERPKTPETSFMIGYAAYIKSRVTAMRGDVHQAIQLSFVARDNIPASNHALQGGIGVMLGYAYFLDGDFANAIKTLNETIRSGVAAEVVNSTIGAYCVLARLYAVQGQLHKSHDLYREAKRFIQGVGGQHRGATSVVDVGMAEVLYERNDLDAALTHLKQGLESIQFWNKADDIALAYTLHARIQQAQGSNNAATKTIEKAAQLVRSSGVFSEARDAVNTTQVRLWLAQGDNLAASRWAGEFESSAGSKSISFENELAYMTLARVYMAQEKLDDSIRLLSHLEANAQSCGRAGSLIEIMILQALALQQSGESAPALATLAKSLALAASEGYTRVFLDEGQPMQMLLARWMAHASDKPLRDYATHLIAQFDAEQQKAYPASNLVEQLSRRELEVLHIMALGKTNQEIAQQLVVARGTVKAHTASIYRKLDVTNRTEAVARARQLGILP